MHLVQGIYQANEQRNERTTRQVTASPGLGGACTFALCARIIGRVARHALAVCVCMYMYVCMYMSICMCMRSSIVHRENTCRYQRRWTHVDAAVQHRTTEQNRTEQNRT
jgi:hypothetical protein